MENTRKLFSSEPTSGTATIKLVKNRQTGHPSPSRPFTNTFSFVARTNERISGYQGAIILTVCTSSCQLFIDSLSFRSQKSFIVNEHFAYTATFYRTPADILV